MRGDETAAGAGRAPQGHGCGKRIVRRVLDCAMTALIVLLLSIQITGQRTHEWIGIAMTVLVIGHITLNRAWYRSLFAGHYHPARILQAVVNAALLVCFLVTAASGILMSQYAVPFLRAGELVGAAQRLHLSFSHWSFVLVSIHLGLHWGMMTGALRKRRRLWQALAAAGTAAAGYGLFLSFRAQIYAYLSFRMRFAFLDYGKAPAQVILENLLMLSSWAMLGYELTGVLRRPAKADPHRRRISLGMIAAELLLAGVFRLLIS